MKLSYLDLTTTDAAYNLAAEQYVFDRLPTDRMYFMLWQNANAIIVGKHQNTLAEINLPFVQENNIQVVRRLSGGGAVYHDMGNLNFTFITDADNAEEMNFAVFCMPIIRTLEQIGIHAEVNGRNDITIGGKKFSGNSQYLKKNRVMHHGTIMFNSNLSVVSQALQVDPTKVQSKGIQSVRSRVTNVSDHLTGKMTLPEFRALLLKNVLTENNGEEYQLTPNDLAEIESLRTDRYATWEWNYGASPECTIIKKKRYDGCGLVEIYMTIENCLIKKIDFRGDFFCIDEPEDIAKRFIGCRPEADVYIDILRDVDISKYFVGLNKEQFLEILNS